MSVPVESISKLKKIASSLQSSIDRLSIQDDIRNIYGMDVDPQSDTECLSALRGSIFRLPPDLVRSCGVKQLGFEDLGPSREYLPNHGRYEPGRLILNKWLLGDPTLIVDMESGNMLNKLDQTLYHELGHGWDEVNTGEPIELSLQPEWLKLSGWSDRPRPRLRRIRIRERGMPELVGEWYYHPEAGFTRFYAKRNPWDDWADSFAYYVGGMKSFLPQNKIEYFDQKLAGYY
jgi:hypothetical protein